MEEPIRKEDIIDLKGTTDAFNELITLIEKLSTVINKDLKASADDLIKSLQGVNAATKEGQELIKNASVQAESLAAQNKELTRLDREKSQLKARLVSLETNEADEVAKLKVAIERKNKSMKDAARLDDSAEMSVNKMRAKLKELTAEYNRLAPALRDKVSPEINKLATQLKKAEGAIGNNTRGVGSYKQAILSAGKQMLAFTGIAGGATLILNKLKEAFFETERGAGFFTRGKEAVKTFFQTFVSTGNIAMASSRGAATFKLADQLHETRIQDRDDLIEQAKLETDLEILRYKSTDATLSETEQLKYLNLAHAKENELIAFKKKELEEDLANVQLMLTQRGDDIALLEEESRLKAEIIKLEGDRNLRILSRSSALKEKIAKKSADQAEQEKNYIQAQLDGVSGLAIETIKLNGAVETDKGKKRQEGLIANEEYYEKQKKQAEILADYEIDEIKRVQQERQAITQESLNAVSGSLTAFAGLFEAQKQRELSAVGDNAQKREEIERKYAKKQQLLSVGQALVNGAMAITEIWKKWAYNPVLAGIFTAVSSAQTLAQVAIIKAQKFARGGSGILEGAVHASGGIQIPGVGEAEAGEHFSIASRSATSKYGGRMLDAVSNSINQGKFFEVWSNANRSMESDPYTKKMYDLMLKTPTIYQDSQGNTVKEYADGKKVVIKKLWLN